MEYKFLYHYRYFKAWVDHRLSAIADPDVEAIVPFAIDLLDIDASLEHIYQSYGGNWPITFYPYYQQGIDEKIKSPTFTQLRQIIDPLRYLNTIYQPRLAIPKYIINASGDDFSYQTILAFIIANFTA